MVNVKSNENNTFPVCAPFSFCSTKVRLREELRTGSRRPRCNVHAHAHSHACAQAHTHTHTQCACLLSSCSLSRRALTCFSLPHARSKAGNESVIWFGLDCSTRQPIPIVSQQFLSHFSSEIASNCIPNREIFAAARHFWARRFFHRATGDARGAANVTRARSPHNAHKSKGTAQISEGTAQQKQESNSVLTLTLNSIPRAPTRIKP